VGNGGINRWDYLGLWGPNPPIDYGGGPGVAPFDDYESNYDRARREQKERETPCCNGIVYDGTTECCIKEKIYKKASVKTKIRLAYRLPFGGPFNHVAFVDNYNNQTVGVTWYIVGSSMWDSPDPLIKSPRNVQHVRLSPCTHDIQKFENCVDSVVSNLAFSPCNFNPFTNNCRHQVFSIISQCKRKSTYSY
jgi:hypothetical protein